MRHTLDVGFTAPILFFSHDESPDFPEKVSKFLDACGMDGWMDISFDYSKKK